MKYLNSLTRFIRVMENLESHEKNLFSRPGRLVTADIKARRMQDRDIQLNSANGMLFGEHQTLCMLYFAGTNFCD